MKLGRRLRPGYGWGGAILKHNPSFLMSGRAGRLAWTFSHIMELIIYTKRGKEQSRHKVPKFFEWKHAYQWAVLKFRKQGGAAWDLKGWRKKEKSSAQV